MMNTEDKFFVVTLTGDGLNVRSSREADRQTDLGNFDLKNGDVIHAIAIAVSSNGATFHKFDRIYREGVRYDFPFKSFPTYVESSSGEYWAAEKGNSVWMIETKDPELSLPKPPKIDIVVDPQPTSTKKYVGWRVLHKDEGGYDKTPDHMPEVIPPENPVALPMTEEIQKMSFELMRHFNKTITAELWTAIHRHDRAFTNFNGFEKKGDPRCNYILNTNIGSPPPKYDKMGRICGGMFIHGIERGGKLVCQPGVHGIDANRSLPSLQTIIDNNWYFFALSYHEGKGVEHFPQGKGEPVAIPFIFNREISFPRELFDRWEDNAPPEATKLYKKKDRY